MLNNDGMKKGSSLQLCWFWVSSIHVKLRGVPWCIYTIYIYTSRWHVRLLLDWSMHSCNHTHRQKKQNNLIVSFQCVCHLFFTWQAIRIASMQMKCHITWSVIYWHSLIFPSFHSESSPYSPKTPTNAADVWSLWLEENLVQLSLMVYSISHYSHWV